MLLTTKGRYASMAMVELAVNPLGSPMTLAMIAERQGIDKGYLEQIFVKLKNSGLVESIRGPGGGYLLGKSRAEITFANIMQAVEEELNFTRCDKHKADGCMNKKSKCVTHHLWENLENHMLEFLNSISLEDIILNKALKSKVLK